MPAVPSLPLVPARDSRPAPTASLAPETCLFFFQDENDNPPTFSKPAYFVSVVENIMAGTGPGRGGREGRKPAGKAPTMDRPHLVHKLGRSMVLPVCFHNNRGEPLEMSRYLPGSSYLEHLLRADSLLGTWSLLS